MATHNTIRAFAPATVANVACGFDVFGLALEHPGDEVELRLNNTGKVVITQMTGNTAALPADAKHNTAAIAVTALLNALQNGYGAELVLHKGLPLASGMGSSAASAVAALVAANAALGDPLSRKALIPFAMEAERQACGAAHADNIAPALLGGFVLVRDAAQLDVLQLPVPASLTCAVVHPHIEINTRDARRALKPAVKLRDAVQQWANTAALVAALYEQDYALLGRALSDAVAEPVRALFIPGFTQAKQAALQAGALGCSISGSGPAMFALCKGHEQAHRVCKALQQAFVATGLSCDGWVSAINTEGARVLNQQPQ